MISKKKKVILNSLDSEFSNIPLNPEKNTGGIPAIKIINDLSFFMKSFLIAGSNRHEIEDVLPATKIEKKQDKIILFKYFFE